MLNGKKKTLIIVGGILLVWLVVTLIFGFNPAKVIQNLDLQQQDNVILKVGITNDNIIGYEYFGNTLHFWNEVDDYYLDMTSGIQLTNHYQEYWTHNIFCAGYKTTEWNYLCNDALPISLTAYSDNLTYVQINGTRVFHPLGADVGTGISYRLENYDTELNITVGMKNVGDEDITVPLAFAWRTNDIKINNDYKNDNIFVNDTWYDLNETLDLLFTNMSFVSTRDNYTWNEECDYACYIDPSNESCVFEDCFDYSQEVSTKYIPFYFLKDRSHVKLSWDKDLDYFLQVKSNNQNNSPVTLAIVTQGLNIGQTKKTSFLWKDPSGLSDTFTDDDNTLLGDHTADGVDWNASFETVADTVYILNNEIHNDAFRRSWFASNSDERCSEITSLADSPDGADTFASVMVNGSNPQGYSVFLNSQSSGNYTQVVWWQGTSFLQQVGVQIPANVDHVVRAIAKGNDPIVIEGFVDGDFIGSFSDNTPITGGMSGFGAGSSGSASGDISDDWNDCFTEPCVGGVCTFDSSFILEDLTICDSNENCQVDVGALIKWGITSIPADKIIDSANLTLWINDVKTSFDDDVQSFLYNNQSWNEDALPSGGVMTNSTSSTLNSTTEDTFTTFDVSEAVQQAYYNGDSNLSMKIQDPDNVVGTIVGFNDNENLEFGDRFFLGLVGFDFDSSEGENTFDKRPLLKVFYSDAPPAAVYGYVARSDNRSYLKSNSVFTNMSLVDTCTTGDNALKVQIDDTSTEACSNCPSAAPGFRVFNFTNVFDGNHTINFSCLGIERASDWVVTETNISGVNVTPHTPGNLSHWTVSSTAINVSCKAEAVSGVQNVTLIGDFKGIKYNMSYFDTDSTTCQNNLSCIVNFSVTGLTINDSYRWGCNATTRAGNRVSSYNGKFDVGVGTAKVYVVFASDTESFDGADLDDNFTVTLDLSNYDIDVTPGGTIYDGHTSELFDPDFRKNITDSTGSPFHITWYAMTHEAHCITEDGCNVIHNIMFGSTHEKSDAYRANVTFYNETYGYHPHFSYWNGSDELDTANGTWKRLETYDGTSYFWRDLLTETDIERGERLVAEFTYDNAMPWGSFRGGWLWRDADYERELISKITPLTYNLGAVGRDISNWTLGIKNYSNPNTTMLYDFRCKEGPVTATLANDAFSRAQNGTIVVTCSYAHNNGFLKGVVEDTNDTIVPQSAARNVEFEYANDIEAAQAFFRMTDTKAPEMNISLDSDWIVIDTNEQLEMPPSLAILINSPNPTNYSLAFMIQNTSTQFIYNKSNVSDIALGYRARAWDKSFNVNISSFLESSIQILEPNASSPPKVFDNTNITVMFKFFAAGQEQTTGVQWYNATVNGTENECRQVDDFVYISDHWEGNCTLPLTGFNDTGLVSLTISANSSETAIVSETEPNALDYGLPNTCTPPETGDWQVNMSHRCNVTTPVNITGRLNFTGTFGYFNISSKLNVTYLDYPPLGTTLYIFSNPGAILRISSFIIPLIFVIRNWRRKENGKLLKRG